jgi:hypothetical protein
MIKPLVSIGLDPHIVEAIKTKVGNIIDYQYLPDIYSVNGLTYVQSKSGVHYIQPRGILYYCYFDNAGSKRRALALSDTNTFPNIRRTILHDDKALSLIAARNVDPGEDIPRGFSNGHLISVDTTTVAKFGEWHCGDGKKLCEGKVDVSEPSILEPFIEGESHRILVVGYSTWQIHYESKDWRKNVNSTITILDKPNAELAYRAFHIAMSLGLQVAGVDFIVNSNGAYLLEVNAYPGLDQVPEAEQAFIDAAVNWVKSNGG